MELTKRNCPIKMELCNIEAGWLDLIMNINGEEIKLTSSYCMGDGFPALLEAVYRLYPRLPEHEESSYIEEVKVTQIIDGEKMEFWAPQRAKFYWDEEGIIIDWVISKDPFIQEEFDINVKLNIYKEKGETKEFTVSYKDFCYALAKAITQTLKKYGINGFYNGYWAADINIRQFLYIKAIGLGVKDKIDVFWTKYGDCSDLNKEIELLMFDM